MPIKSNKFDFTNRTSRGVKIGQIIGHALEKEADKILKDATKHSQQSKDKRNAQASSPQGDAYTHISHLDIRAPSKELGDEGCFALIEGLGAALSNSTARVGLALEDLNLTNNNITTAALKRLGSVIRLAGPTLRSLNLSSNHVKVGTAQEAQDWDDFLRSLEGCTRLRKIDLSGNVSLGSKAMEILARLHVASDHIPPVTRIDTSETSIATTDVIRRTSHDSAIKVQSFEKVPLRDQTLRAGLRSVAYIVLNDTGLDDCGALWLSYLIEDHFFPIQLVDDLESTRIDTANPATPTDGIEWSSNETSLGKDGILVLKKASVLREQLLKDGDAYDDISTDTQDQNAPDAELAISHGRSTNIQDPASEEHESRLLRSARSKIQRGIMVNSGASSVDLWRAALQVVTLSRMFLMGIGVPAISRGHVHNSRKPIKYVANSEDTHMSRSVLDENKTSRRESHPTLRTKKTRYLPLREAEEIFQSCEGEYLPPSITPTVAALAPNPRSNGRDRAPKIHGTQEITEAIDQLEVQDSNLFLAYQQKRSRALRAGSAIDPYRDETRASHFPPELTKYLIRSVLTLGENDALTAGQFERAYQWGCNRTSLQKELEWLKDHKSIQIMRLLETIDCMEYGRA
jgi:hypothetical protein